MSLVLGQLVLNAVGAFFGLAGFFIWIPSKGNYLQVSIWTRVHIDLRE